MKLKPIPFLLIAFVVIVELMSGCSSLSSHPSDALLEQRLRSHQADFDNLVRMFEEDSDVVQITDDTVFFDKNPTRILPKTRLEDYRGLFKTLQLEGGIKRETRHISLFASSKGMVIPNSGKVYVYSVTEPSPLVESLDEIINSNHGDQPPVYKKLFGRWYLLYESW